MTSIYGLKPAFQRLLRPACRWMAARGVTANQVTVLAAAISFLAGGVLWFTAGARWALLLIPVVLFVRMALNAIDGMLAREFGMKSALGAVLNEVGDVASDAALYLPFAAIPGVNGSLVALVAILAAISEMTGVVAVQIGASRRYDGPMGKSDRAFAFGLLATVLGAGAPRGTWVTWALAVVTLLLVVTILNRARRALGELRVV